jgi:8-oxo-dGTP diphosphatase
MASFQHVTRRMQCFVTCYKGDGAKRLKVSMPKSSKLVAIRRGKVLLVRRKKDGRWMFPGGRKRGNEDDVECLRREIKEELPGLKVGRISLWRKATAKNKYSGRKMSDAIFVAKKLSGKLEIGDKKELDKAEWRIPRRMKLTPTSRYIRDKFFPELR